MNEIDRLREAELEAELEAIRLKHAWPAEVEAELRRQRDEARNVAAELETRLRYAQRRSRDRLDAIDRYREALEQIIAEALHDTGEEDLADVARQALADQEAN